MAKWLVAAVLALLSGQGALAQDDSAEMQLQRCIWACLAGTSGPDSPEYNVCVDERCTADAAAVSQNPARRWQSGEIGDGSRYAGVDVAGRAGEAGIYYFCRSGAGRLMIVDPQAVGGLLHLVVDGLLFPLEFGPPAAGRAEATLAPGDPLITALRRGDRFEVQDTRGRYIYNLSLQGADAALAEVVDGC